MESFIVRKEKQVPVYGEYDVLVAGGGTAGSVAAIQAARLGLKVLIVEQFGALGGSATLGLVTPLMNTSISGNPMCSSISDEINHRCIEMGYGAADSKNNEGYFDPLALKFVLEEMAEEAGVKLMYYSFISDVIMEGNCIKGVIAENKSGSLAILAKRVIDATGDADVAVKAGVKYEKGDETTGKNQPISLRYTMGGIDIPKFVEFLNEHNANMNYEYPFFHSAVTWDREWPLKSLFIEAEKNGDLTNNDIAYWQAFGIPGKKDGLAFNCPEIFDRVDGTNVDDLTNAQVQGKKAILRHLRFYKKYLKGFENAYIAEIAVQVGIRESRRICGVYCLTNEDVLMRRKFEDAIAKSNYPVDIHGYHLKCGYIDKEEKDTIPYYEVPYRSLVPKDVENLIVAGRCISAEFLAEGTLRVQPTVRAIGESSGTAAFMSLRDGVSFAKVDGKKVREEMINRGAKF